MTTRILVGDCRAMLATLDAESVQTCVTSPPYFGLRDYGHAEQIGLEQTPAEYVAALVEVFRAVRRVLRDDGTLWLNLGDSYASAWACNRQNIIGAGSLANGKRADRPNRLVDGLKEKDLMGIPWRVAFALQEDGWYLRSDIIWAKPNPMPESVTDRPTKAHEYVFLLTKSARYCYDADAIREESEWGRVNDPKWQSARAARNGGKHATNRNAQSGGFTQWQPEQGRNARTVWTIATQPYSGAHFATMPPALAERCVKAGSKAGDTVLDPFAGAGTTLLVADRLGRDGIGCELNPDYAALAEQRIHRDAPLFVAGVTA